MLWNFDRARTFKPMVSNGIDKPQWRPCSKHLRVELLSGGYGRDELERADAYCVYEDPADLLRHIHEGGRPQARRRCLAVGWCATASRLEFQRRRQRPREVAMVTGGVRLSRLDRRQRQQAP
jgi:hypothetical protein